MTKIFKPEIGISAVIFGLLLLITFYTNSTGDSGDSISHYLYARYAFQHPYLFLNHWAKPIFVLCSSPFAQFGFKGIVAFNCICATLSTLFTFYIAKNLHIKYNWFVFISIFFAPLYFNLIFSGLTEYLFGLFLVIGIYLICKSKYNFASIVISFLPLIRSEGLLILPVFALFYFTQKKYISLLFLLFGQLIYSLIGFFYYHDILWVFDKIPYASMISPYGKGHITDFIHRLNYVIEKPIYLLLTIGSISLIYSFFKIGLKENNHIKALLIFGCFIMLFIAHSLFWWLGIFNSMGLPRVLLAVIPLIAILSLIGLNVITNNIKRPLIKNSILYGTSLLICFYPFTNRKQGVVFNKTMFIQTENKLINDSVVPFIKKNFPNHTKNTLYFSHPYISLALDIDCFDPMHHKELKSLFINKVENNTIIIWDDWFSVVEEGVTDNQLQNDQRLKLVKTFRQKEKNRTIQYSIFVSTDNKQNILSLNSK